MKKLSRQEKKKRKREATKFSVEYAVSYVPCIDEEESIPTYRRMVHGLRGEKSLFLLMQRRWTIHTILDSHRFTWPP